MKLGYLAIVSLILGIIGAQASGGSVTIHIKAVKGRIEFSHHGKRLTDSKLEQLCATSRRQKLEIAFQRERMNSNDTMASLLKEAQCLSATRASGFTKIGEQSEAKPAAHTHAKHRHRAAAPR